MPEDQPQHREHVLTWLCQTGRHATLPLPSGWPARPQWRWTVDTLADLTAMQKIFELLGARWRTAAYPEIAAALDQHPEIMELNRHVVQKT